MSTSGNLLPRRSARAQLTSIQYHRPPSVIMTYRACGSCFSMDVYPYLGFETGRKYQCKTCGTISPFVVEFETVEALKAFKEASK